MATYKHQARWSLALGILGIAALLVASAGAQANSLFVRAVDQNGVNIEVTFHGAAVDGPTVAGHQYVANDCTGTPNKFLPADVTTFDDPSTSYKLLGSGWTVAGGSISLLAPSPVTDDGTTYVFSHWTVDANGVLQNPPPTSNPGCFNGWTVDAATNVTAHYVPACPNCEEGPGSLVVADENVTVDLNPAVPTCDDGVTADLCDYFSFDKSNPDPSQWKAIFDLGGKKLVIQDNVTVTVVNVPSSTINQKAPGIVIEACELRIDPDTDLNGAPGRVLVQSVNQQAGDILLQIKGNVFIGGTVRNEVTGTNGKPGEITIASCCGDVETGPKSRVETLGVSTTGGGDINILTCCERGYLGLGGDIVINGLVLAQHKSGPAPTINVAALVGTVGIDGRNVFGIETVAGTAYNRTSGLLVHTFAGTDGGDINVQARDNVTVRGNTLLIANRPNFGAVAIKTNNTNAQGGNGTIDVRSLEGEIVAIDRSFDLENRFNHANNTFIFLSAKGDIDLSVSALTNVGAATNKKFVVSSQGGSGGQGGRNTLHSFAGDVIVGANVQVLANAPGGLDGANNITSCSVPQIDLLAEILPAPFINVTCDDGPEALFQSCAEFGVEFEDN